MIFWRRSFRILDTLTLLLNLWYNCYGQNFRIFRGEPNSKERNHKIRRIPAINPRYQDSTLKLPPPHRCRKNRYPSLLYPHCFSFHPESSSSLLPIVPPFQPCRRNFPPFYFPSTPSTFSLPTPFPRRKANGPPRRFHKRFISSRRDKSW